MTEMIHTLTKEKIADELQLRFNCPLREAKSLVELVLEEIKTELEKGEQVKISGFGKWLVKEKRARPGRNPHTGEKIEISARKVVVFHPAERLRAIVNGEEEINLDEEDIAS